MTDDANNSEAPEQRPGLIRRLWRAVATPSKRFASGLLVVVGGIAGILFWGGFNWAMEMTNTEAFCVSCHEMSSTVAVEWEKTKHYENPAGVRAICSDCHVPKAWHHKVVKKIKATGELYGHFMGTIDTKEKFEAHRLEMAENVWAEMKANDSRACRNCHSLTAMEIKRQSKPARLKHERVAEEGGTCIDCHKGIAHKLPRGWSEAAGSSD